jgi:hypothetical protein
MRYIFIVNFFYFMHFIRKIIIYVFNLKLYNHNVNREFFFMANFFSFIKPKSQSSEGGLQFLKGSTFYLNLIFSNNDKHYEYENTNPLIEVGKKNDPSRTRTIHFDT